MIDPCPCWHPHVVTLRLPFVPHLAVLAASLTLGTGCDGQDPIDDGISNGETAGETEDETEDETEGETEGETAGETEGETAGETEDETAGETEGETVGETEQEPESCDAQDESRECEGGTQFCDHESWGECLTELACQPGDLKTCGFDDDLADLNMRCLLQDGVPMWNEEDCNTPLVLSFDARPVETRAASASFDISGLGACLSTDWPEARTPWLAIDLDKNGFIDGGHELFGSGSVLESGRHAQNGFVALATLDSDHDGAITPADTRYGELLLWADEDGDKRSQPYELTPLSDSGVDSISLGAQVRELCDARGNCGRERAVFQFTDGAGARSSGEIVDIYLACQ